MNEPIRVLHILDTDQFAGTEQHLLTLIPALSAIGVENFLACRRDSPLHQKAMQQGIEALPAFDPRPSMSAFVHAMRSIRAAVRKHDIDILHTHNGRTELLAAILKSSCRVRVVSTQHFIDPQHLSYSGPKRIVSKSLHQWVGRRVDATIAVSEAVHQAVSDRKYYAHEKIRVVLSGIVPASPAPTEVAAKVRAELGCVGDQLLVVTAARLESEKGIDCLIDAISKVVSLAPSARFAIVGKGGLRDKLARLTIESGIEKDVIFTGFREDIQDLIDACDIFVLPSPNEPFGLVLLEAMAAGKPVVAAAQGGPLEIVEDGVTGLLFEPENADSLADKISILIENPEMRAEMGQRGAERFTQNFTAQRMARDTVHVYERALQTRRTSADAS